MRLWHQKLIPYLDDKRLLSQHRECCALRGKGWGRKHSTVDYVFTYDLSHLYQYHLLVMHELAVRNFYVYPCWYMRTYRGKHLQSGTLNDIGCYIYGRNGMIYKEHDNAYLKECLLNLRAKNAQLIEKNLDQWLIELDLAVE